jgi:hypothetical protein
MKHCKLSIQGTENIRALTFFMPFNLFVMNILLLSHIYLRASAPASSLIACVSGYIFFSFPEKNTHHKFIAAIYRTSSVQPVRMYGSSSRETVTSDPERLSSGRSPERQAFSSPPAPFTIITSNNMELKLQRKYRGEDYTVGSLYIDGEYFCDTQPYEKRLVEILTEAQERGEDIGLS